MTKPSKRMQKRLGKAWREIVEKGKKVDDIEDSDSEVSKNG